MHSKPPLELHRATSPTEGLLISRLPRIRRCLPLASILATAGAPQAPGIERNSFDGPGYKDVDASIAKGFGLPTMPVLGDKAKIEFRVDAFNLFNNLNIDGTNSSLTTNITASNFGQASRALGSRVVDIQARFSF